MVGVWRDITVQKCLERDLNEFAYVASHDLRAPLRAIKNISLWIAEDAADHLPRESLVHLQKLQQRVDRLDALLDDMLQYSRAGRLEGEITDIDTGSMVAEVARIAKGASKFTICVGDGFPVLHTVGTPLRQVLSHLLDNSIKHHDRTDGHIDIQAHEKGDFYEFVVTDDGPGIPCDHHERVFQLFRTLQPRDRVEGSGMGLAIVKKIVEHQGGYINLESQEGAGATFRFIWPKFKKTKNE